MSQRFGSAAEVIADGEARREQGLPPVMGYLTETNPWAALASAMMIEKAQASRALGDAVSDVVAGAMIRERSWYELSDDEAAAIVRWIVRDSETESEICGRLLQIGAPEPAIRMKTPDDLVGREARDLVSALGGLVTKSGAMVMVMIWAPSGELLDL